MSEKAPPVFLRSAILNDDGTMLALDADKAAEAGVKHVELIEDNTGELRRQAEAEGYRKVAGAGGVEVYAREGAALSCHGRIMNIRTKDFPIPDLEKAYEYYPEVTKAPEVKLAYQYGHRDARHAAAEIALEADRRIEELEAQLEKAKPVDLLLYCPKCGEQHIDEARPDVCETCGFDIPGCKCGTFTAWLNPPHKSHRCEECNHVWRPADVPTNGVRELKTKGSRDGDPQPRWYNANLAADARIRELETELALQAEDHTPPGAVDALFMAGVNQCLADEEHSSRTECPYPPDSISRHWWTRGYAHQARALRAVELEAELAEAAKSIKAHAELMAEANTRADRQTKRADSYARTAQACLRDAGPVLVKERERVAQLEAALREYADRTNWLKMDHDGDDWMWQGEPDDPTAIAQAALAEEVKE
jgi:rubrerythrin